MKIHVRVKSIEDKITEYVNTHSQEIYIDRDDELSNSQVDRILAGESKDVRFDIEDVWSDDTYYWEEMCKELNCTMDDVSDYLEGGDMRPYYELTDQSWHQLLRNTQVYITATVRDAEWNFNNWAYGEPLNYSDVKTSLKVLGINPLEFKNLMSGGSLTSGDGKLRGWFPDMPDRIPKVDINNLWGNMCVLYDGVLNFCLGDLKDIEKVVSGTSKNITFKKGTNIVMYNFGCGAGITEVKLTDDVTIPRKMVQFKNDKSNKYGIQKCYEFTNSYWEEGGVQNG